MTILKIARVMAIVDGMRDMSDAELIDHGYAAMARTALDHLREPTEEMIAAGREQFCSDAAAVKDIWRAMIDVPRGERA